jgi:hypothetical protein
MATVAVGDRSQTQQLNTTTTLKNRDSLNDKNPKKLYKLQSNPDPWRYDDEKFNVQITMNDE